MPIFQNLARQPGKLTKPGKPSIGSNRSTAAGFGERSNLRNVCTQCTTNGVHGTYLPASASFLQRRGDVRPPPAVERLLPRLTRPSSTRHGTDESIAQHIERLICEQGQRTGRHAENKVDLRLSALITSEAHLLNGSLTQGVQRYTYSTYIPLRSTGGSTIRKRCNRFDDSH